MVRFNSLLFNNSVLAIEFLDDSHDYGDIAAFDNSIRF
jgi:hypothetical protein